MKVLKSGKEITEKNAMAECGCFCGIQFDYFQAWMAGISDNVCVCWCDEWESYWQGVNAARQPI